MHYSIKKSYFLSCTVMLVLCLILGGCREDHADTKESALSGSEQPREAQQIDLAACAPTETTFTLDIDNPYFPLPVGRQWFLEGQEDDTRVKLRITVLDETEKVGEVVTRVVEEREWAGEELVEVSRNYFAQAANGTVCYFGEEVDEYDEGAATTHAGAWRADEPGHAPGIIMPATPKVGMVFQQEVAPGIAEDEARITAIGEKVTVPAGTYDQTLRTQDINPLEGGTGDEKVYERDVGLLVDGALRLVRVA